MVQLVLVFWFKVQAKFLLQTERMSLECFFQLGLSTADRAGVQTEATCFADTQDFPAALLQASEAWGRAGLHTWPHSLRHATSYG